MNTVGLETGIDMDDRQFGMDEMLGAHVFPAKELPIVAF